MGKYNKNMQLLSWIQYEFNLDNFIAHTIYRLNAVKFDVSLSLVALFCNSGLTCTSAEDMDSASCTFVPSCNSTINIHKYLNYFCISVLLGAQMTRKLFLTRF